jgi:hypothetical protein
MVAVPGGGAHGENFRQHAGRRNAHLAFVDSRGWPLQSSVTELGSPGSAGESGTGEGVVRERRRLGRKKTRQGDRDSASLLPRVPTCCPGQLQGSGGGHATALRVVDPGCHLHHHHCVQGLQARGHGLHGVGQGGARGCGAHATPWAVASVGSHRHNQLGRKTGWGGPQAWLRCLRKIHDCGEGDGGDGRQAEPWGWRRP